MSFMVLSAFDKSDEVLKKEIGRMLIVGFRDANVTKDSTIVKQIQKYDLGGVILFDREYKDRTKPKNIRSKQQLKALTSQLQSFANKPLLISIDQEGGRVARLKKKYGFAVAPSAKSVAKIGVEGAKIIYKKQAKMLSESGINCDLAPVVDLEINPKNRVIVGLERSYGDAKTTIKYARIFIDALKRQRVLSVLKHFPGHGSSQGDSHKGFVDISDTWSGKELKPYRELIKENRADIIMSAHVFNRYLDKHYPATLSYKINQELLRDDLGFNGVLISDDMQMGAITQNYSLKEAVTLAINSGVDMLLFGNQLAQQNIDDLVDLIFTQVKSGAIDYKRIQEANRRIELLQTKRLIVQKPIEFKEDRINLTKEYILQHYGLDVKDITIKPKIIVLHWTAIVKFKDSFHTLYKERLEANRPDIKKASLLNVSAHFMVDRDGTIYQLMPDNWMARHVIGLNYSSIGVENVGGKGNKEEDLTPAQLASNIKLVRYLKQKYPGIEYLIGHYEYKEMQSNPLWLEKDAHYRTHKADPGKKFMKLVRESVKDLGLKNP